jgi:hypothetical protein
MFLSPSSRAKTSPYSKSSLFWIFKTANWTSTQKSQARTNIGMQDGQIPGTTTNDNASAGNVGELIESSVTGVSITSTVQTNVTSISLTAGDWDVWANIGISGTSTSVIRGTITTTSATIGSGPNGGAFLLFAGDQVGGFMPIGQKRLSLSATTTVYLVTQTTGTGTLTANGYLGARRRR